MLAALAMPSLMHAMTSKSTFQPTMGKAASKSGSLFSVISEIEITDFQLLVQKLFHQIWAIFENIKE